MVLRVNQCVHLDTHFNIYAVYSAVIILVIRPNEDVGSVNKWLNSPLQVHEVGSVANATLM